MTGGQIVATTIEVLLGVTLILGFVFQDKLVAWEEKFFCNSKRKRNIKRKK